METYAYITIGSEMLDEICYRYYGTEVGTVEQVLAHPDNRELAEKPLILPEGTTVFLPKLTVANSKKEIKLWQ